MADAPCSTEPLLKTPLHAEHLAANARMCAFGGWDMPLTYEGQLKEHDAVRNRVGIFDVSHMGQVRFKGAGVLDFLNQLVPGRLDKLTDGFSSYTQLCNDEGGIIDDLIITRVNSTEYFAVVNASTREGDVRWMREVAKRLGTSNVNIVDESSAWGMIAVQGPQAFDLLCRVVPGRVDWANTPAFTLRGFTSDGRPHLLSRTGYTGEVGAELLVPADLAATWWKRLIAEGATPCGLAARDSLRLEAGYCLYGSDLDLTTSPVEAALSWSVDWKKTAKYIGRERLDREKATGAARRLVGVKIETRRPLRHGDKLVNSGGAEVGVVTSGGYSPILNVGIGLAYLSTTHDGALFVQTRSDLAPATIVKPPFVKTSLSK
jgi:aminomethyltransferase